MNVTIIGTGNMAKGISARLLSGGHTVTLHSRDVSKASVLVDELNQKGSINAVSVGTSINDQVILFAVPYGEVANVIKQYGDFDNKTVIDITNPVNFENFELLTKPDQSAAEEIASLIPNANIVKGFNTIFAGTLESGVVNGEKLDVLLAGDNQEAKDTVTELVNSSGLRAVDAGALTKARYLEGIALIHMTVQEQLKSNWMSAIKILS